MSAAVLDVSPGAYEEVARVLGEVIPTWVGMAWSDVVSGLGGTYGMAGSDPAGQAWGASYQDAAEGARTAAADLIDTSRWLAALVAQTGGNYAAAEGTSIVGATAGLFPELASAKRFASGQSAAATLRDVQTAVGTGASAPFGWSLLEHAIGRVWPNGHQDLLHVAERVWRAAGAEVLSLVEGVDRAITGMRAVRAPEVDAIVTLVSGASRHVSELGRLFEQIGDSCAAYAHHLDQAHHAILAEVKSFLEWSAGIEVVSGLFAVMTLGASEALGQGGEGVVIARAAAAIRSVLELLSAAIEEVRLALGVVASRIRAVSVELRVILTRRLEQVQLAAQGDRGAIQIRGVRSAEEEVRSAKLSPQKYRSEGDAAGDLVTSARTNERLALDKIGDPEQFDPHQLEGFSMADVRRGIPDGWVVERSASGGGEVFRDPVNRGRQIRLMPGYEAGSRPGLINSGPYAVVSQNGTRTKVALSGNPTLK